MSGESNFTIQERVNLLLKKQYGKPTTSNFREFYQEPSSQDASPSIIAQRQLWSSIIPDSAPSELVGLGDTDLDDNGFKLSGSVVGKTSFSGIVKKFIKIPMSMVAGSNGESYETTHYTVSHPLNNANGTPSSGYGQTGLNISYPNSDIIPFNFDPNGTYLYKIYRFNGSEINFGHGEWVIDVPTGILMFQDYSAVSSEINAINPPLISFYKYTGIKGLSEIINSIGTTIFDSGTNGSIGDDLAALQIGNQSVASISSGLFTDAIQFGSSVNGAFRICIAGNNGTGINGGLVIQKKFSFGWKTVCRLAS